MEIYKLHEIYGKIQVNSECVFFNFYSKFEFVSTIKVETIMILCKFTDCVMLACCVCQIILIKAPYLQSYYSSIMAL